MLLIVLIRHLQGAKSEAKPSPHAASEPHSLVEAICTAGAVEAVVPGG
jgi:hypothetical protein